MGGNHNQKVVSYFLALNSIAKWYPMAFLPHKCESFKQEDELYQPQVKVATSLVEDGVCIEVKDNGIGMDDVIARQAFEPLFTTRARGSGLGLAIARKIVEEHGGTVSLDSEPERGTKAVVIPLKSE